MSGAKQGFEFSRLVTPLAGDQQSFSFGGAPPQTIEPTGFDTSVISAPVVFDIGARIVADATAGDTSSFGAASIHRNILLTGSLFQGMGVARFACGVAFSGIDATEWGLLKLFTGGMVLPDGFDSQEFGTPRVDWPQFVSFSGAAYTGFGSTKVENQNRDIKVSGSVHVAVGTPWVTFVERFIAYNGWVATQFGEPFVRIQSFEPEGADQAELGIPMVDFYTRLVRFRYNAYISDLTFGDFVVNRNLIAPDGISSRRFGEPTVWRRDVFFSEDDYPPNGFTQFGSVKVAGPRYVSFATSSAYEGFDSLRMQQQFNHAYNWGHVVSPTTVWMRPAPEQAVQNHPVPEHNTGGPWVPVPGTKFGVLGVGHRVRSVSTVGWEDGNEYINNWLFWIGRGEPVPIQSSRYGLADVRLRNRRIDFGGLDSLAIGEWYPTGVYPQWVFLAGKNSLTFPQVSAAQFIVQNSTRYIGVDAAHNVPLLDEFGHEQVDDDDNVLYPKSVVGEVLTEWGGFSVVSSPQSIWLEGFDSFIAPTSYSDNYNPHPVGRDATKPCTVVQDKPCVPIVSHNPREIVFLLDDRYWVPGNPGYEEIRPKPPHTQWGNAWVSDGIRYVAMEGSVMYIDGLNEWTQWYWRFRIENQNREVGMTPWAATRYGRPTVSTGDPVPRTLSLYGFSRLCAPCSMRVEHG